MGEWTTRIKKSDKNEQMLQEERTKSISRNSFSTQVEFDTMFL